MNTTAAMVVPREDLINSAVAFLQDPTVAGSPLDKRRAFLESKNLTAEEIQLALARAGEDPAAQPIYTSAPQQRAPPPPPGYGYGYQPYPTQWPAPPMEPPRRDWRDWFIMATVTTGVGYGLYTLAKRYVAPIIAPPTPPQLEQDKASVDESFAKAFALIDQLTADTAALKSAEEQRNERLDNAIGDIEAVLSDLKAANAKRETEARRTKDDIAGLRELIPTALQGWKSENERRLGEVGQELRSLKMLVGNRVGVQAAGGNLARPAVGGGGSGVGQVPLKAPASASIADLDASAPSPDLSTAGFTSNAGPPQPPQSAEPAVPAFKGPDGKQGFSFEAGGNKRSIPAWQLAASASSADDVDGSSQ